MTGRHRPPRRAHQHGGCTGCAAYSASRARRGASAAGSLRAARVGAAPVSETGLPYKVDTDDVTEEGE